MSAHISILVQPIIEALLEPFKKLAPGSPVHTIVDCTLGGGGHTLAILEALNETPELRKHQVLSIDRDPHAIEGATCRFKNEIREGRLQVVHAQFSEISPLMANRKVLGLMADLGFSSDQLGDPSRGLSFQSEGPLDMRLDPTRGMSAYALLSRISERDLVKILLEFGEERFSSRIATTVIRERAHGRLPKTTKQFSEIVRKAVPPGARHGKIHVATRSFQALRIAVNEELKELDYLLEHVILSVVPGGRIAIISFHSLEDRKVKQAFRQPELFRPLTKRPLEADSEEQKRNPRSRSAKLRIAERC